MQPLQKRIEALQTFTTEAWQRLSLDEKQNELSRIDNQLADSSVWSDSEKAGQLSRQAATLRGQIEPWQVLRDQIEESAELVSLGDESLADELSEQCAQLEARYDSLSRELLFGGIY